MGVYNRGGIDLNQPGIGPTLNSIKSGFAGPNGAGVTGGQSFGRGAGMQTAQASGDSGNAGQVPGSPLFVLAGLVGFAAILWLARKNSTYLQQNTLGFNTFNVITIGVIASVWIILAKVTFNKLPQNALTTHTTTLVNAL